MSSNLSSTLDGNGQTNSMVCGDVLMKSSFGSIRIEGRGGRGRRGWFPAKSFVPAIRNDFRVASTPSSRNRASSSSKCKWPKAFRPSV
ncbi:hypothetical protein CDAR_96481 [Caerostris darwini]|uniref:Uncharacterized protein n=1 Tax=Caerostris darwini TaxID=1538125 RepID=A0AAV4QTN4_9ARAC|nr:hypothetical protein CDAR_96481 [Caerostris darwini]